MRLYAVLGCIISSVAWAQELAPARLKVRTNAAEAVITIDGEVRGLAPRTEAIAPGVHTIVAETKGAPDLTQTVSVTSGEERTITFEFAHPVAPRPFPSIGTLMVVAGGVLVTSGLLLRGRAEEAAVQVSRLFERGGGWDASGQKLERDGLAAQNWSWFLVGTGVAAVVSGVIVGVLEVFGAPAGKPTLVLVPTPGGAMVSGALRW